MFSQNAKIERLKQVPLFSECSKRELAEIAGVADELHFGAGETLIEEGAQGREFIVVLDGDVEITRRGRHVEPGDFLPFFGEAALLTGRPRNATVRTATPVDALVITKRAFDRILKQSPGIQLKVMLALASRLANRD
jgi:CRP/FNR family transcriptional regulator, cyclic AMP receptor protein